MAFSAPIFVAKTISAHFCGEREAATVLDMACGTGQVAKQVKHFAQINLVKLCKSIIFNT